MACLPPHELGPLHGIKVVDFGVYLAGPLVGRILADAGATVYSIVPPTGPLWHNPPVNHLLSRGKKVVALDLKSEAGLAEAWEFLRECDVVVENFSPGVMRALGLDAQAVRQTNSRCVYLSLPGFASQDPDPAIQKLKAYEGVILARAGVYADMGLNRTLMGINPSYSPLPLASTYGSVVGALGIVLALYGREGRTGQGDRLEVPLAAALCDALVYNSMDIPSLPARYVTMRELEIGRHREEGKAMKFTYPQVKELLDPFYHTYVCADGRPFYVVAPCHALHQKRALQVLGIWEDMVALGIPEGDVYAETDDWRDANGKPVNMLLGTYPLTDPVWIVRLKDAMKAAFLKRPALEWEQLFMAAKVTGCATRTTEEWLKSEHALASGLVQEREWTRPDTGKKVAMQETGPLVWHNRSTVPGSEHLRQATQRVAREAFLEDHRQQTNTTSTGTGRHAGQPPGAQRWLTGTKVVDLCNVIAGPTIGGMLSRFGATVVKVDPSRPTYDALVAVFMGVPINTGKKSLLADVKDKSGREILRRLVLWADVVLCNQTSAQLRPLGIDEASLKKINPHVILTQFDAFGGPYHSPRSDAVGYDDLLQASTGIMARFGGGLKTPEEHAHLGTVDVVSGFSGALSTVLALFKRLRTGQADVARTSLAANAQHIQTPFMYDFDGRSPFSEPSGPSARGEHALYRWYSTPGGGHVFVASPGAGSRQFARVSAALVRVGLSSDWADARQSDAARTKALQQLLDRTCSSEEDALRLFQRAGVSAVALSTLAQLRDSHLSDRWEFSLQPMSSDGKGCGTFHFNTERAHPIGGKVTMFSPCSLLSEKQTVPVPFPAPRYGEHTTEVLTDLLGFSHAEVEKMKQVGIVSDGWSSKGKYIPDGDPWAKVTKTYKKMMDNIAQHSVARL